MCIWKVDDSDVTCDSDATGSGKYVTDINAVMNNNKHDAEVEDRGGLAEFDDNCNKHWWVL